MPAIPNSLNSGGRRRDPRSMAGLSREEAMMPPIGGHPLGLPPFGSGGGGSAMVGTGMMVGRGAGPAFGSLRPPKMGGRGLQVGSFAAGGGGGYGGGGGGGASMGGGGGGTPGFSMGPRKQSPFSSDRDGSTIAPVSGAAGGGLNDFYDANPGAYGDYLSKVDASRPPPTATMAGLQGDAPRLDEPLAYAAYGTEDRSGPLAPGQPFIAGDPQKDGKPNPEIIIPSIEGTHVIPIKDLHKMPMRGEGTAPAKTPRVDGRTIISKGAPVPAGGLAKFYADNPTTPPAAVMHMMNMLKHPEMRTSFPSSALKPLPRAAYGNDGYKKLPRRAYGTLDPERFNMGDVPLPDFVPQLETGGAFGKLLPFSDGSSGVEARDVNGIPVGYATGIRPVVPQGVQVPHGTNSAMPSAPLRPILDPQEEARLKAMNPDGIDVGFTPRAPLTGFAQADALRSGGGSREDRDFERLQRQVMRAAKGNPHIAAQLLDSRAADARSQNSAAASDARLRFTQGQINARTQDQIEAANARFEASQKTAADRAAFDRDLKLAKEERDKADFERSQNPDLTPVPIAGTNNAYVPATKGLVTLNRLPEIGTEETFPGSGVYMRTKDGSPLSGFGQATMESPGGTATLPAPSTGTLSPGYFGGAPPTGSFGASFADSPVTQQTQAFNMPPQFKQQPTGKDKPPTKKDIIKEMADMDTIIFKGKENGYSEETIERTRLRRAELIKAYDTNGDGKLSPEEAAAVKGAAAPKPNPQTAVQSMMKRSLQG